MSELLYTNFTKLTLQEKKVVLAWRNSDRVRLRMDTQQIISLEDHLAWIESLQHRTDCIHYLVRCDGVPMGVLNHVKLDAIQKTATGGSYIGDETFLGMGMPMWYYGQYDFFVNLKMERYYADILKSNARVYKMHTTIFRASNVWEDQDHYYLCYDREWWQRMAEELKRSMEELFHVSGAHWIK